jgi:hypothetical protein
MVEETKEQIETWEYLRASYYPRFKTGIIQLSWDERFEVLKTIHGDWEDRGDDPLLSMIEYISEKGYFSIFCKGVDVFEDGSFKIHKLISVTIGNVGIYDGI